jgi:hypothetical protein
MHRSGSKNQDSVVKTELAPRHLQARIESTVRSLGFETVVFKTLGLETWGFFEVSQQESVCESRFFNATLETLALQPEAVLDAFFVSLNTAYDGGVRPRLCAHRRRSAGVWQQHSVQHLRAVLQPHRPCWQGNGISSPSSDDADADADGCPGA